MSFSTAHHIVNAGVVVSPRGFGRAASLCMLQLWVSEAAAQTALAQSCPRSVSKSLQHAVDAVMRRQDTSCACVQVVEPFWKTCVWRRKSLYTNEISESRIQGIHHRPLVRTADGRPHTATTRKLQHAEDIASTGRNGQKMSAKSL